MIIGICGLIGSGKNTVADYLVEQHGFAAESFARSLKDAVAAVFGWDREMLEGLSEESRQWRDTVDPWWSNRLGMLDLTPRFVLQYWGTQVLRGHFHDDIWIASLERRLESATKNVVITDLRFPNEFEMLRRTGAYSVRVRRGADPDWFSAARELAQLPAISPRSREALNTIRAAQVHESEWAWAGQRFDWIIDNNSTLDALYDQVQQLLSAINSSNRTSST